jgi:hypothetical protein
VDRYELADMLSGTNILSLDTEALEAVKIQEIVEGLLLHHEQIKQDGKDPYIVTLQREGRFSAFENEAAGLVAGFGIDPQRIQKMPEHTLRTWIVEYLGMLSRERRKAEKTTVFKGYHGGF